MLLTHSVSHDEEKPKSNRFFDYPIKLYFSLNLTGNETTNALKALFWLAPFS